MKSHEILTFKADLSLRRKLEKLSNRSEFIRNALLVALKNACEFCSGSGILSSEKRRHWLEFAEKHTVKECDDCQETEVECRTRKPESHGNEENNYEALTFKVSKGIAALLKGIKNRSEFIRNAVVTALENICPWCKGSGVLTPKQKEHWIKFSESHRMRKCGDCHELTLICAKN
jgi:DnaJ-class molecular chaperone